MSVETNIERDDAYWKRQTLFWTTCIPLRIVLTVSVVLSATQRVRPLQLVLAAYLGSWGGGLLANFLRRGRAELLYARASPGGSEEEVRRAERLMRATAHGNFGGVVWWQWHRLVHGLLLLSYAVATVWGFAHAYAFALFDVAYGIAAGLFYYRPCGLAI